MEYQKIINLLNNTWNQPTEFRTVNRLERNDESRAAYNNKNEINNNDIEFKTSMVRTNLCEYRDPYILV